MNSFTHSIISVTFQMEPWANGCWKQYWRKCPLRTDPPKNYQNKREVMPSSPQVFSSLILIQGLLRIQLKLKLDFLLICSALFMTIIYTHKVC